jgi:hypothetical protein
MTKIQSKTSSSLSEKAIPAELMEKWLTLIHRASTRRMISYRERMQLLWLYTEVEKRVSITSQYQDPPPPIS